MKQLFRIKYLFANLQNGEFSYFRDGQFITIPIHIPDYANTINGFLHTYGGDSNLVYCNSVGHTINYAIRFAESKKNNKDCEKDESLKKAAKIVSEYIHPDYYLAEIIKKV